MPSSVQESADISRTHLEGKLKAQHAMALTDQWICWSLKGGVQKVHLATDGRFSADQEIYLTHLK